MDYEPWQKDRIRQGLRAFQLLGGRAGSNYSFPELEIEIESVTGQKVPHGRLQKFVMGENPTSAKQKEMGIKHYPSPSTARLDAIVEFLTNPESTGYMFTKEDLALYAEKSQGPLRLMEYLNSNSDNLNDDAVTHSISPKFLSGVFSSIHEIEEQKFTISIRFRESVFESLIEFALIEYNDETIRLPETFEDEIEQLKLAGITLEKYRGFAVVTPEENLMLFGKHERLQTNLILLSIGIDNAVFQDSAQLNGIVLLKHDFPVDYVTVDPGNDQSKLLLVANEKLKECVHYFIRVDEP